MTKEMLFEELVNKVSSCNGCPRMEKRTRVLGLACGKLDAQILFIGEAPGRLGADISGIPFTGDQTGDNFNEFIESIHWNRDMFFITNAVLCNPRDNAGNNAPPLDSEIKRCSVYLEKLIEIIRPKLIITLGNKALKGLGYIKKHNIELKSGVARIHQWNSTLVFPLYSHDSLGVINIRFEGSYIEKENKF